LRALGFTLFQFSRVALSLPPDPMGKKRGNGEERGGGKGRRGEGEGMGREKGR